MLEKLKNELKNLIALTAKDIFDYQINPADIELSKPPEVKMGDFSFPVFTLSKALKKSPNEIAESLAKNIQKKTDLKYIKEVKNIGPYINFFLTGGLYAKTVLEEVFEKKDKYGSSDFGKRKKVLVEYSGPNTNKPQHVGHLRNNVLGYSYIRILQFSGHHIVKLNIINDRGIHICKSMLAYKKWGDGKAPKDEGLKPDHFVGKYYAMFGDKEKEDPSLIEEAREMLREWEAGGKEVRKLWKKLNDWIYEGWDQTYKSLGVSFDEIDYESEMYESGKGIVEQGLKKGLFYKRDDGAIEADLAKYKLDKKVLVRSDGTSVYITQDIGVAYSRVKRHPDVSQIVHVVASPQEYHFKVLFKLLELLGIKAVFHHLSYGLVSLKTGKMSSRAGNVVLGDDLIWDIIELAKEELKKRETEDDERALKIGMSALKYYLLRINPHQKLTFDMHDAVSFEGNTGPYIQYAYARIKSIERKFGSKLDYNKVEYARLSSPEERELISLLEQFDTEIIKAAQMYNPSIVCTYLLNLAQALSTFYHEHQILNADQEALRDARLALAGAVSIVLKNGLALLGIEAPEKM